MSYQLQHYFSNGFVSYIIKAPVDPCFRPFRDPSRSNNKYNINEIRPIDQIRKLHAIIIIPDHDHVWRHIRRDAGFAGVISPRLVWTIRADNCRNIYIDPLRSDIQLQERGLFRIREPNQQREPSIFRGSFQTPGNSLAGHIRHH